MIVYLSDWLFMYYDYLSILYDAIMIIHLAKCIASMYLSVFLSVSLSVHLLITLCFNVSVFRTVSGGHSDPGSFH